jgi:hypothetical protein
MIFRTASFVLLLPRLLSHLILYILVAILASRMTARAGSPGKRELVLWVPVLVTVHNVEEALGFKSYLPRLPVLLPEPFASFEARLSYPAMLGALVTVSALAILIAACAWFRSESRGALWALLAVEATMALNVVAHVTSAVVVFRGYGPGLITAVAVNGPFAIYFFRRAAREQWVSQEALWATIPMALLLHGPVLIAGLWLAALVT